jgi:hypothetical protein
MPTITSVPRRGAGDGARHSAAAFDILFRRLVRHVCRLGPRVVGEILLRLVPDRAALLRELQRYVRFDPASIRYIGAADWIEPQDLLREVRP